LIISPQHISSCATADRFPSYFPRIPFLYPLLHLDLLGPFPLRHLPLHTMTVNARGYTLRFSTLPSFPSFFPLRDLPFFYIVAALFIIGISSLLPYCRESFFLHGSGNTSLPPAFIRPSLLEPFSLSKIPLALNHL